MQVFILDKKILNLKKENNLIIQNKFCNNIDKNFKFKKHKHLNIK